MSAPWLSIGPIRPWTEAGMLSLVSKSWVLNSVIKCNHRDLSSISHCCNHFTRGHDPCLPRFNIPKVWHENAKLDFKIFVRNVRFSRVLNSKLWNAVTRRETEILMRAVHGSGIGVHRACKFILQIIQPGISRLVCVWGGQQSSWLRDVRAGQSLTCC